MQAHNHRILGKVEAEESEVQGRPSLPTESEASLCYMRPCQVSCVRWCFAGTDVKECFLKLTQVKGCFAKSSL